MKKLVLGMGIAALLLLWNNTFAQTTYHDDDKEGLRKFLRQPSAVDGKINAEQFGIELSDTLTWNSNEDWVEKISGITWNNSSPKRITDITGYTQPSSWRGYKLAGDMDASYWKELSQLVISETHIQSLDITQNALLTYLICGNSDINSLDLSQNSSLLFLECRLSSLDSLDLRDNTELQQLDICYTSFANIDLSKNTKLTRLTCQQTRLTSLDISKNTELTSLDCFESVGISSLDVSQNTKLQKLACAGTSITSLDLSRNTALNNLSCGGGVFTHGQLTSLNVAENLLLKELYCSRSEISSIDLGENVIIEKLNISENKLLFSAIPAKSSSMTNYTYAPQKTIQGDSANYYTGVDLSTEYSINDNITSFTWFDITGGSENAITPVHSNEGVFTFDETYIGKKLRCKMTNETFPLLSGNDALKYEVVITDIIHVSSLSLNLDTIEVQIGETGTLEANILPENATIKKVTWESDNDEVATVDNEGIVSGLTKGTAVVTATCEDGDIKKQCVVIVKEGVGLKEILPSTTVQLYPNPVQNTLYIQSTLPVEQVVITDLNGKVLKQYQGTSRSISFNQFPDGIYLVKIKTAEDETIHKIIKK